METQGDCNGYVLTFKKVKLAKYVKDGCESKQMTRMSGSDETLSIHDDRDRNVQYSFNWSCYL
ncbi:hypothetical protein HanRHA438_Chr06g0262091 [Helianthus annuus]|nr:hypothetical protein HanRHA438_Chr06g0262091 [Helianthus annuus]